MRLDLNQAMQTVIPWDFTFVIDGVDYPTAKPSEADLNAIRELRPDREAFEGAIRETVFAGLKCPDLSGWDNDRLAAAIIGYTTYAGALGEKKIEAIADQVKAGIDERPTARRR